MGIIFTSGGGMAKNRYILDFLEEQWYLAKTALNTKVCVTMCSRSAKLMEGCITQSLKNVLI